MKLIIGLGNPGEKHDGTRHNLGFVILDEFARKQSATFNLEKKFKAEVSVLKHPDFGDLILAKPQTFMNLSGMSVALLVKFYKILPEDVVIIHDDLDLLFGKIKIRLGGSAAGHHGVESIIESLSNDKFIRVRAGIGNDKTNLSEHHNASVNIEHFVLEKFLPFEKSKVKSMIVRSAKALELLLEDGLETAQNQFN